MAIFEGPNANSRRRINWVLDCDVQSFFDKVSQSWLIRFIEHRIAIDESSG
jgi:RNA-directed DNA polymerase